ncbi:hypothetical protein BP5796_05374 [Coleophoma crateriformis]|uniref:FAD dependent oxidoreductase domain-containing protein n=1 Tax=Coleophoma crateriformis TaxID=565419 RepID=A0A3D8S338_9HELO|nr:hypothetical protein BP5796_05374 [Coleophoma crateriformis]
MTLDSTQGVKDASPQVSNPPVQATDSLPPNPFPTNQTVPFWRTELHELNDHRSTSELPGVCDVLIVGSGFSGASLAYHLVQSYGDEPLPSIVMLEARQACSGATSRNGGHVKPSPYFTFPQMAELYGVDAAEELAEFELLNVLAVKDLVEKEQIACDYQLTRACDAMLVQSHADQVTAAYKKLQAAGVSCIRQVQYTGPRDAEQISGVKGALCCFTFPAAHLWPYKLVMHLLSLVVAKGVNLQTTTPVTSVSKDLESEKFWVVETPRGKIKTKKIVYATNGYTGYIAPQYSQKIIPIRGICSRIVCSGPAPHLPNTYSVRIGAKASDYLIPRADGSIVVGGAKPYLLHDSSLWYNVVDDTKIVEPAREHFEGYMQKHFRGWENSGAYTDRVWSGIQAYTTDLVPHVGEVPEKPGQFIMGGFNGHGMPNILLTAKALAIMVKEGKPFEEVGLPRAFKTTKERLADERNLISR